MIFLERKLNSIKLLPFIYGIFALSLFADGFSVSVKEVRGFAFIERRDKSQSFSVFRGSEIKESSLVKTDSKSQLIISVVKDGSIICDVLLNNDTVVLVNRSLFGDENRISLSLLQGRIKVQTFKDAANVEMHMANVTSVIKNGDVELAIAMDGSSIIYFVNGEGVSYTDTSSVDIRIKDIYIIESGGYNFSRSTITPDIFINNVEDKVNKDIDGSLSRLIELMRELNDQFVVLDSNLRDAERQSDETLFGPVEVKAQRLLSANEGYYHSASKILEIEGARSRNAFEFTKTLNNLYFLNNRYIDKINFSLERNKARIERTKKLY